MASRHRRDFCFVGEGLFLGAGGMQAWLENPSERLTTAAAGDAMGGDQVHHAHVHSKVNQKRSHVRMTMQDR